MRLFHFSEERDIGIFEPRPVRHLVSRPPGMDWLNGPLVWAIDDWHQPMYLFPRECPRILVWPVAATRAADWHLYWSGTPRRMTAYIEDVWLDRFCSTELYRYELPAAAFESLDDAGMWISRVPAKPIRVERMDDLAKALQACDVELQAVPALPPLQYLWNTTLHVSGIRLRNARGWPMAQASKTQASAPCGTDAPDSRD